MASENYNVSPPFSSYMAALIGMVPAAGATDIFTIAGGKNRRIEVNFITISGISSTAIAVPVSIIKRTTPDTSGTPTLITPVQMDMANPSLSQAVIQSYAANPALGSVTNGGLVASARMILSTGTASVGSTPFMFSFERMYMGCPVLLGPNDLLAINFNGTSVSGGSVDIHVGYNERPLLM